MVGGTQTGSTGQFLCKTTGIASREWICRCLVRSEEVIRIELNPRRRGSGLEPRPLLAEAKRRVRLGSIGHLGGIGDIGDRSGMTGRGFLVGQNCTIRLLDNQPSYLENYSHLPAKGLFYHDDLSIACLWESPTIIALHLTRHVPAHLNNATISIPRLCKLASRTTRIRQKEKRALPR